MLDKSTGTELDYLEVPVREPQRLSLLNGDKQPEHADGYDEVWTARPIDDVFSVMPHVDEGVLHGRVLYEFDDPDGILYGHPTENDGYLQIGWPVTPGDHVVTIRVKDDPIAPPLRVLFETQGL